MTTSPFQFDAKLTPTIYLGFERHYTRDTLKRGFLIAPAHSERMDMHREGGRRDVQIKSVKGVYECQTLLLCQKWLRARSTVSEMGGRGYLVQHPLVTDTAGYLLFVQVLQQSLNVFTAGLEQIPHFGQAYLTL